MNELFKNPAAMVSDFLKRLLLKLPDVALDHFKCTLPMQLELRVEALVKLREEMLFEILLNFFKYILVVLLGRLTILTTSIRHNLLALFCKGLDNISSAAILKLIEGVFDALNRLIFKLVAAIVGNHLPLAW